MITVDIWLRGQDVATTAPIDAVKRESKAWTDDDVRLLLEEMLQAMHRLKHPDDHDRPMIALRGLSWIVNPYEDSGVVIAIEIAMGAAIAGPFDIDKTLLEAMIARVVIQPERPPRQMIH